MKNQTILHLLLIPCVLFIGTLSPSDGVDGPIEKSPMELLITAGGIFLIGAIIMFALKLKGALTNNNQ